MFRWFFLFSCLALACTNTTPPLGTPEVNKSPAVAPVAVEPLPREVNPDIPCETVDDCWATQTRPSLPMARPAALRGKLFKGCQDGAGEPVCNQGRCDLVYYDC
jgi:hypothetical protein